MPIFATIIVCSWVIFILFWIISAFGVKRDIKRSLWQRFAWLRIVIVAIILSLLWKKESFVTTVSHLLVLRVMSANTTLSAIGTILNIAGIALAVWARVHLGRNWSPAPSVKEEHELIISGPYQLVRHPIYTGILAAALGTAFVIPLWIILFVIIFLVFIWRVKTEEGLMTKQFPSQYQEYKKRTWALVPYVW